MSRRARHPCPECQSPAVGVVLCEDDDGEVLDTRFLLRCGECGTWREEILSLWAAHALERRLRREQRRMARALRRLERAGVQLEPSQFESTREHAA